MAILTIRMAGGGRATLRVRGQQGELYRLVGALYTRRGGLVFPNPRVLAELRGRGAPKSAVAEQLRYLIYVPATPASTARVAAYQVAPGVFQFRVEGERYGGHEVYAALAVEGAEADRSLRSLEEFWAGRG